MFINKKCQLTPFQKRGKLFLLQYYHIELLKHLMAWGGGMLKLSLFV